MDLLTAITTTVGPVVTNALQDIWNDYRRGRDLRKNGARGTAISAQGYQESIPLESGVLSIPEVEIIPSVEQEPPISVEGEFIGHELLVDAINVWLEEEHKIIVLFLKDEETDDVFFLAFGFEGYSISMWPGVYSLYAFIVDPDIDEVLAWGYPAAPDLDDPNPLPFRDEGTYGINFMLFPVDDSDDQEEWTAFGWDLENMDESQFDNLTEAAQGGDSEAQFELGKMLVTGRYFPDGFFVPQDKDTGYQLVKVAAEQGHAKARGYLRKSKH